MKGKESYTSKKIDKNKNDIIIYPKYNSFIDIDYNSALSIKVSAWNKQNTHSGWYGRLNNIQDIFNINEWIISIDSNSLDTGNNTSGILDELSPEVSIANRFLMLFAFGEQVNNNPIPDGDSDHITNKFSGFGLWHQPKSLTDSISSGSKGASSNITNSGTATYTFSQFTIGAKVLLWYDVDSWNTGVIQSVENNTNMTIKLDDHGTGYGYSLDTTKNHTIIQLDRFRPYTSVKEKNYSDYYQLISMPIRTYNNEGTDNIYKFSYNQGIVMHDMWGQYSDVSFSGSLTDIPLFNYVPPSAIEGKIQYQCGENAIIQSVYCSGRTHVIKATTRDIGIQIDDTPCYPLVISLNQQTVEEVNTTISHHGYEEKLF